jgi:hypothetical protein
LIMGPLCTTQYTPRSQAAIRKKQDWIRDCSKAP